jgi:hypothetical protein
MEQETCRWLAWLPAHALGALDGGDGQALQAHLAAGCARCEAELRALRLDVEALAHAVPAVAPAPATRDWLLTHAASTRPRPWRLPVPGRGAVAAALAGILVLALGSCAAVNARRATRLAAERDALVETLARAEVRLDTVRDEQAALARRCGAARDPRGFPSAAARSPDRKR